MAKATLSTRFRGVGDLRLVRRQIYYEQLNFWLNPVGAIFTVGFSIVFLVLVGSTAGHQRSNIIGGQLVITYYVPGFIAYGVMAACFNQLAVNLVVRREMGLLKRLRLSPLPAWAMLAAVSVSALIISAVQVVLVLLIGRLGYHVPFPHNLAAFAVALVVGAISFTCVGLGVSTLIPNQEAGAPITNVVFFVLLFFSGLWFPISSSSGLATFSSYFPVRHLILSVFDASIVQKGVSSWPWHDILVMAIWGVAGALVALRRWSWAPRQARRGPSRGLAIFAILGGRRLG
ncbi:MAG: ABC transporter permease [Acidimicrobiales bacterium]